MNNYVNNYVNKCSFMVGSGRHYFDDCGMWHGGNGKLSRREGRHLHISNAKFTLPHHILRITYYNITKDRNETM